VEDTQAAVARLRSLALTFGGYVAEANLWQVKEDLMRGMVTLRVDASRFDEAIERIKEMALEVQRENVSSQDVTEEYVDLEARLRNLEATEQELLALLAEVRQRTRNADEVLQVYRELTRIREEIERIKGRMQYLDNRVQLATISVELIPQEEKPIVQPGWHPGQTLRDALSALARASQALVSAAIWLGVFVLPMVLVLAVPVGLIVAGVRRWWRSRPAREAA
jgi:DNA repair ATPase RecN